MEPKQIGKRKRKDALRVDWVCVRWGHHVEPKPRCPDPMENPDDCTVCEGGGHRCTAFCNSHSVADAQRVQEVYASGWDPAYFYTDTAQVRPREERIAARRAKQR